MKINSKFLFFIFGCFFFIETINSKAMVRDDTSKSIERYGNMHNDEKKKLKLRIL